MAMFLMEMPGSYGYTHPMQPESKAVYHRVIDHLAADGHLAADRIAMVGVSFGGYWTARLAAANDRLACAIACGAPTHRSFHGGALGTPQIILHALANTVGAAQPIDLAHAAANATLLLYPDDDHCAMGHYRQWLDYSQHWLVEHLLFTAD